MRLEWTPNGLKGHVYDKDRPTALKRCQVFGYRSDWELDAETMAGKTWKERGKRLRIQQITTEEVKQKWGLRRLGQWMRDFLKWK